MKMKSRICQKVANLYFRTVIRQKDMFDAVDLNYVK